MSVAIEKTKYIPDEYEFLVLVDGYKRIDYGAFAHVYANENHVVKVARSDWGYLHWLKYCVKNQGKGVPVIYRALVDKGENDCFVEMERLVPLRKHSNYSHPRKHIDYKDVVKIFHDLVTYGKTKRDVSILMPCEIKTAKAAHKFINQELTYSDIKSKNIMFRPSSGHFVLIDPLNV